MNMEVAGIKSQGKIDERCIGCFFKTYQRLFNKFNIEISEQLEFTLFFKNLLINNKHLSSPEIQRELNVKFCQILKTSDPFKEEKKFSNRQAIELYNEWKPKVISSIDPFNLALRLAIAGNIMDYGANNSFDIHATINAALNTPLAIDHSTLLKDRVKKSNKIIYLGDNAGEIVFDKLFIETIMHNNIIYAVKDAPVLNDVTITDAKETRMDLVADVISNGFDAPSTILHRSSHAFLEEYNSADLVISKGQGNFEGLMHQKDSRIFFLLMAKCDVIAEILKVEKSSFVVYNQGEC